MSSTARPSREQQVAELVAFTQDQATTAHKLTTALTVFAADARPRWDLGATDQQTIAHACVEFTTTALRAILADFHGGSRDALEDAAARLHDAAQQFRRVGDSTSAGVAFGAGIIVTEWTLRRFWTR